MSAIIAKKHEVETTVSGGQKQIASGAITIESNFQTVYSESSTTDDLTTINGSSEYMYLILGVVATHQITIKHNVGNIICPNDEDILLDGTSTPEKYLKLLLWFDVANGVWVVMADSGAARLLDSVKVSELWESDGGAIAAQTDASGNVGVNTSSPSDLLDVRLDSSSNQYGLTVSAPNDTGAGSQPAVLLKRYNSGVEQTRSAIYSGSADEGDIALSTGTGTSPSTSMLIDGNGIITQPRQCMFYAYVSSNITSGTTGNGAEYTIAFNTEYYDRNSDYKHDAGSGQYTFLAPTTGVYHFSGSVWTYLHGAATYLYFRLRTTSYVYYIHYINTSALTADQYNFTWNVQTYMLYSQQAWVTFQSQGKGTNDITIWGTGSRGYTWFAGNLIG